MSPELRSKVEEAAKQNRRSLNAEISARLESTFPPSDPVALPEKAREQIARVDGALHQAMRDKLWRVIDEAIDEAINNSKKK